MGSRAGHQILDMEPLGTGLWKSTTKETLALSLVKLNTGHKKYDMEEKKIWFSPLSHLRLYVWGGNGLPQTYNIPMSEAHSCSSVACSSLYVWRMHQVPSRRDGAWTQTLLLTETEILKHRALVSFYGFFQKVSSPMGGQPEGNLT